MEKLKCERKPTGRVRNKSFTIKCTENELKLINETLDATGLKKTDALLKFLKIKKEIK